MYYSDEFSSMYDDWMVSDSIGMKKTFVAKELMKYVKKKYPDTGNEEISKEYDCFYDKALAIHQKLNMMLYAEYNLRKVKADFEATQNMECPALYGLGKTQLLFYLESVIIFARCALDASATIFSDLIFNKREDSFNNFAKRIIKSEEASHEELKKFIIEQGEDELSAFRLLCGVTKGRALRDIIIHQANIRLEYYEYKENSDKEKLFIEIKGIEPVDFEWFVDYFSEDVIYLIEHIICHLGKCVT